MAFMTGEDSSDAKKKKGVDDLSKVAKATDTANKIVGDAVLGIRTVASFNLEHRFLEDFAKNATFVSNVQKRDALGAGFGMGITQVRHRSCTYPPTWSYMTLHATHLHGLT